MLLKISFKNNLILILLVLVLFRCSSAPQPPPPSPQITKKVEIKSETIPIEPPLPPEELRINFVKYNLNEMVIQWEA